MKHILSLNKIGKADVCLVGGKGAQLCELKKFGLSVPEGFVITTNLHKIIIIKLKTRIQDILSCLNIENTKNLEEASSKIRSLIISADLPKAIEKEIIRAYSKMGGRVAVRSSATAEDQKEASFAGQMDSFLNVGKSNLIETVKKCIASLFTARAIYYIEQKKIEHMKVHMAVVVQKMVLSKKAGVAFSINPVNNNEKEIIIEATRGLGEQVVGGQTTPDNYVIDKEGYKIKESRIKGGVSILNEQELKKIASAVEEIAEHYNFPQDIEWAIGNENRLYILQSRPVTTLQIKNKPVWKKIMVREYGVQYTELSIKCLSPLNKHIVPHTFYEQVYIPENGNQACYVNENEWNDFVAALKEKWVENHNNYEEFEKMFMKAGNEYVLTAKTIAQSKLKGKSDAELKAMYSDYLKKNYAYGPFIWAQFIINNLFAEKAKEILARKLGKDGKKLYDYVEVALRPEKKAASTQLNEIASKWASFSGKEKNITYENFKWIPCLDIHNRPWTREEFFHHINEFRKAEKKLPIIYEMLIQKTKFSEKDSKIIGTARKLAYLKDLKDDFRRQGILYGQKLFEEIADRMKISLEDASYLTEEELMGFLEYKKSVSKSLIEERKKGFVIYCNKEKKIECRSGKGIKSALNELGIITFEELSEEIKGATASQGVAKGPVTIVRSVLDLSRVKKGDILVAVTTHPDYVPAMQKAAAIVTDEGGITSHAAIIARELGLPCIVGTRHATKLLKDADEIEVDANSGIVRKIKGKKKRIKHPTKNFLY